MFHGDPSPKTHVNRILRETGISGSGNFLFATQTDHFPGCREPLAAEEAIHRKKEHQQIIEPQHLFGGICDGDVSYRNQLLFLDYLFGGEQSTCCPNVLTATGSDGGGDPFCYEFIPEVLNGSLIGRFKRGIRNGVKPDQIDPATNPLEDSGKLIHMGG